MPSFREVFYGHKKKNYVYACGKWQKLSFCCLFFSQGRINLKIFPFVVKRKWFLLFLLDLFNAIGAGKVRESMGIFFLLSFLSWCSLNQSVEIQFSPCYCVRYLSFYPVHRFQQQFYAKCKKACKISVYVP